MNGARILVVKIGGGYLKAILPGGQETIYGRDESELIGRLRFRKIPFTGLIIGRKRTW
jgi:hypothetical protein